MTRGGGVKGSGVFSMVRQYIYPGNSQYEPTNKRCWNNYCCDSLNNRR